MKNIFIIFTILLIGANSVFAHDCSQKIPQKLTYKEQKQMDKFFNEKLNLSKEQQNLLEKNRTQHRREMKKIIDEMQELHDKIKNVYLTGIPKFQADLRTAPMKAQLVSLKQNADKLRQEHRKNFENILTPEQKIIFESLKKEIHPKNRIQK